MTNLLVRENMFLLLYNHDDICIKLTLTYVEQIKIHF